MYSELLNINSFHKQLPKRTIFAIKYKIWRIIRKFKKSTIKELKDYEKILAPLCMQGALPKNSGDIIEHRIQEIIEENKINAQKEFTDYLETQNLEIDPECSIVIPKKIIQRGELNAPKQRNNHNQHNIRPTS